MEQKNVNFLVMAFVFLIVGVALIGTIASSVNDVTDKRTVYDESVSIASAKVYPGAVQGQVNESISNFTLANYPTDWKKVDCPLAVDSVENTTDGLYTLILGTDYELFNTEGIIRYLNVTTTNGTMGNNTYVTYTYCADGYINSSWGRSVLVTVPGFFALALLGVSLWLFYAVFRSTNLINKK